MVDPWAGIAKARSWPATEVQHCAANTRFTAHCGRCGCPGLLAYCQRAAVSLGQVLKAIDACHRVNLNGSGARTVHGSQGEGSWSHMPPRGDNGRC